MCGRVNRGAIQSKNITVLVVSSRLSTSPFSLSFHFLLFSFDTLFISLDQTKWYPKFSSVFDFFRSLKA